MRWLWIFLFLQCGLAFGHAELLQKQLVPQPSIEQQPNELRLLFNETVEPLRVELLGAAGPIDLPAWQHQGEQLLQPLPELDPGQYWLRWQVRSLDGHPVNQDWRWQWGEHQQIETAFEAESLDALWHWLWPVLLLPLMLLLVGQRLLFTVLPAWPLWPLWPLLVLQSLYWLSLTPSPPPWPWLLLALAGLCSLLMASWPRVRAVSVAVLLLASVSVQGHANAFPLWLQFVYALHWVLAALWFAALTQLCLQAPLLGLERLRTWLACFSAWALPLLLVTVLAGASLVWQQLGWPLYWPVNLYQGLLLAKLGLLSAILLLAAWHRWGLPKRLKRGLPKNHAWVAVLWVEWALLLILLWVTAVMATQAPRTGHGGEQTSNVELYVANHQQQGQVEDWRYEILWSLQAGEFHVQVAFLHQDKPQPPEELSLRLLVGDDLPLTLPFVWQGGVLSASWPQSLQTQAAVLDIQWLLDDFRLTQQIWPVPDELLAASRPEEPLGQKVHNVH